MKIKKISIKIEMEIDIDEFMAEYQIDNKADAIQYAKEKAKSGAYGEMERFLIFKIANLRG